jgi:hypothetical protein
MRRFSQKDEKSKDQLSGQENFQRLVGYEAAEKSKYEEQLKKYIEAEKGMIEFCEDLKNIGIALKSGSAGVSGPYSILATGLSNLGDKLISIGNDAVSAIETKNNTIFGLGLTSSLISPYQPAGKKVPGAKRFIPFIGDVINFTYTLSLKPEDFINPIKIIFSSYKCDNSHPKTKAPLMLGIYPNFSEHPELDDQYRAKMESVSSLSANLGALIQNMEAALAYIAAITGHLEFTAAVRLAGGMIQTLLLAISIVFSPNTYDLIAYSKESFKGGGFDPSNPLSVLNKIPGASEYIKIFESKPIAEETKESSESRVQNFILVEIIPEDNIAIIKDTLGNYKALAPGEKWPKWNITITGIFRDHVEYKDSSGKNYSIRYEKTSFSDKNLFDQVMKDAANLSTSGVKGDVNKLLSKKIVEIMKLVYQLQSKYPWIGDSKNAKFINLQADILSHNTRSFKRQKPNTKPVATTPKPTAVPNLREITIENYKQKYFREDQAQLMPEIRGSAVKVKLQGVMDAIKSGTLSQMNWDKWSDIGKQAIIEEAIDRLQNAGFNVINPTMDYRTQRVPPISKDILNQLSPKYKSLR